MGNRALNFKMEEGEIKEMKEIASVFHMTMTDVIKAALREYMQKMKKDPYYRLTVNVQEASPEETDEILKEIEQMSDDDLTIVNSETYRG